MIHQISIHVVSIHGLCLKFITLSCQLTFCQPSFPASVPIPPWTWETENTMEFVAMLYLYLTKKGYVPEGSLTSFYEAGKPGEQNTTTHSPLIYSRWKTNLKKQKVFPHVPKATKRIKWNKYGMLGNKQIGESPWSPTTMQFHRTSIYQYPIEEKISDLSVHSNGIRCCSPVSNCTVSSGIGMFAKWIW